MSTKIFVNLPVKDLDRSIEFFRQIGYEHNPTFTDENGACIVFGDDAYAMLLTEPFFRSFTNRDITDLESSQETITAIGVDSREKVDEVTDKALAAGAQVVKEPQSEEFMYARSFTDPDGHHWEFVYMDMNATDQLSSAEEPPQPS